MGGTYISEFSAGLSGMVVEGSYPPNHEGYARIFAYYSNRQGYYGVEQGIVPAKWGFRYQTGPCNQFHKESAEQIKKNEEWDVDCIYTRRVVGLVTLDGDGNFVDGGCCATDTLSEGMTLLPGEVITSADDRFTLTYQWDGNLVLWWNETGYMLWSSGTAGSTPGRLDMQLDGNLVIYNESGAPVWHSGTVNYPGSRLLVQKDGNMVIYDPSDLVLWASNTCCH